MNGYIFLTSTLGLTLIAAGGGLLQLWHGWRGAKMAAQTARERLAMAEARLAAIEGVLAAHPDHCVIWDGEQLLHGAGNRLARLGTGEGELTDLLDLPLAPEEAARLEEAVARLRQAGTPFLLTLATLDARILEAIGRPAGACAVLWLRDVSALHGELNRLPRALDRVERERQMFRETLDAAPFPIWRCDIEGRLVWVNLRYARAVEADSPEEAVERGEALLPVPPSLQDALQRGRLVRRTLHAVVDGERRALEIILVGLANGSIGFATDITATDTIRADLERHIRAHTETLDSLAAAVAIFDADKHLSFFNAAFARLWQLSPDWLATHPHQGEIFDAMRTRRLLPEQADFRAWKEKILRLYDQLVEPVEELWHLPDETTLRVLARPHPLGGVLVVYEDVTERLALQRSYNTLIGVQRETLDHLHEAVALFGSDGLLKLFNPTFLRIWNLDRAFLEQQPHVEAVFAQCATRHPNRALWDGLRTTITDIRAGRRPEVGRMERPDGLIIDYAAVPLPDGATLLTWLDVTDSARVQRAWRERIDALETADRLKGEFISHVSYQLRTPLTAVLGFAEILEHEFFAPLTPRQHEYSQGILEASRQLLTLINDMIDLATIEAGAMTLATEEVELSRLLANIVEMTRPSAGERDLRILIECPPDIGSLRGDPLRLRQVLLNLVSNAIRFTAPGGRIVVGATRDADEVQIWVRDTGIGIDPEFQNAVFEKFTSRSINERRGGAGLGLSLVRSIIEMHGGRVELRSTPGIGTCVICHLPRAPEERLRHLAAK